MAVYQNLTVTQIRQDADQNCSTVRILWQSTQTGPSYNLYADVGTYTLTVSFAENGVTRNYDIICISDTFEITKKDLTITAVAEDRKYDETAVGGNFSYLLEGIVDGDEQYLGEPVYSGSAITATESGSYILRVEFTKFDKANNYNIIYVEDLDFVISAPDADQAEDNE